MILRIALLLLVMLGCGATPAFARPVLLGHFAPGAGEIVVYIDAREVAMLNYRETTTIELSREEFRIEARRVTNGALLQTRDIIGFVPNSRYLPAIFFAGDAQSQPYQFMVDRGPPAVVGSNAVDAPFRRQLFMLAPFAGAEAPENSVAVNLYCTDRRVESGSSGFVRFDESGYGNGSSTHDPEGWTCRLDLARTGIFTLTVSYPNDVPGLYRMLAIGNGVDEPYEAIVLLDDRVIGSAGVADRQPGALLTSETFWFDATRPGQGISLFEIPGARAVLGTWYTYEADGSPVWYVLDGGNAGMPGRRDVLIYRADGSAPAVAIAQVGTGRIVYADCNEAEFRAVIGDSVRVMSARRAKPVQRCTELD